MVVVIIHVTVGEIPTIPTVHSKSICFEQGELKLCGSTCCHSFRVEIKELNVSAPETD